MTYEMDGTKRTQNRFDPAVRAMAKKTMKGHAGRLRHAVRYSCECGWESDVYWGSGMTGQAAYEFQMHKVSCLIDGDLVT